MEEVRRTNCAKWHDKVACPSGQVANGFILHVDGDNKGVRGISLKCATLRETNSRPDAKP